MKLYTQIRQSDGGFEIWAGTDPDSLEKVGTETTRKKAEGYRVWWVQSSGADEHVNHGYVPLVPLQGKIPGH